MHLLCKQKVIGSTPIGSTSLWGASDKGSTMRLHRVGRGSIPLRSTNQQKTSNMKLVKYDSNWADEMDIDGFRLFTDKQWEKYQKDFQKHFKKDKRYTYYVGTNEDIEYGDFDGFMSDFKVSEITDEEAAVLSKLFDNLKDYGYGFFPELY